MGTIICKIDWAWVKKELFLSEKVDGQKNKAISECAQDCLKKAADLCGPKIAFEEKKVSVITSKSIKIEGGIAFDSPALAAYLKGAQSICVFLVTIGSRLEKSATKLMKEGNYLEGYLLDRIGSFAVESLAQDFEDNARKVYGRTAKTVSMRFSPGYCNWPIEEQLKLDKIIGFSKIGISLTESCMMSPKKSISAVMGIGPMNLFRETKRQCSICDKKDCSYRRIG